MQLASQQRFPHRRFIADLAVLGVRLGRTHQGVVFLVVGADLRDGQLAAQAHFVRRPLHLDQLGIAQDRLNRQDAAFNKRLLILGVLVLRVFLGLPLLHRLMEALRDVGAPLGLQELQFVFQLLEAFGSEKFGFVHNFGIRLLPIQKG